MGQNIASPNKHKEHRLKATVCVKCLNVRLMHLCMLVSVWEGVRRLVEWRGEKWLSSLHGENDQTDPDRFEGEKKEMLSAMIILKYSPTSVEKQKDRKPKDGTFQSYKCLHSISLIPSGQTRTVKKTLHITV